MTPMPAPLRFAPLLVLLVAGPLKAQVSPREGTPTSSAPPVAAATASGSDQPLRATYIPNHADQPVATAVRTTQHIDVDGKLDEPVWMSAPPVTELWQYDPQEGI